MLTSIQYTHWVGVNLVLLCIVELGKDVCDCWYESAGSGGLHQGEPGPGGHRQLCITQPGTAQFSLTVLVCYALKLTCTILRLIYMTTLMYSLCSGTWQWSWPRSTTLKRLTPFWPSTQHISSRKRKFLMPLNCILYPLSMLSLWHDKFCHLELLLISYCCCFNVLLDFEFTSSQLSKS